MSLRVSLLEVRNALRCPRLFALGRSEERPLAIPLVPSPLSAGFHRIIAAFAEVAPDLRTLARFSDMSDEEGVSNAIADALIARAVAYIDRHPRCASMPLEADELSEALRQFGRYLTRELKLWGGAPAPALRGFLGAAQRTIEHTLETGGEPLTLHGPLSALEAPGTGAFTVIEYKLPGSEALDRAQVALYRRALFDSKVEIPPVVLRFQPQPAVTLLADVEADAVHRDSVLPVLQELPRWANDPCSAPPPSDRSLCAFCPVRTPCRTRHPEPFAPRDRAPATAARPLPDASGELLRPSIAEAPHALPREDEIGENEAERLREAIESGYRERNVSVRVGEVKVGPRILSFEILAKRGSLKQVDSQALTVAEELARELDTSASYTRALGSRFLDVVRRIPRPVSLDALLARDEAFLRVASGRFVLGEDQNGSALRGDLSEPSSCHLLIGGTKESGKTELLKALLASLAHYHGPEAIRFTLVEFEGEGLSRLAALLSPHLTRPVYSDVGRALSLLDALHDVLQERYRIFERAGVEDLEAYNEARVGPALAREVVVIDEYAPLVATNALRESLLSAVQRLSGRARAAGVHLVLATGKVEAGTVPPVLKANLIGRIALQLPDAASSRLLLGQVGAERLLGSGDLYADFGAGPVRAQAARIELD